MAFIQPCFIRKNTPELRKQLEELGYFPPSKIWYNENFAICTIYRDNVGEYFTFKIDDDFERIIAPSYPYIDCGTNEELFIALASMTDNEYGLCDYYIVTADRTMIDKVCKLIEENISYVCLHLGNYMEKEVDAKELSEWIRKAVEE